MWLISWLICHCGHRWVWRSVPHFNQTSFICWLDYGVRWINVLIMRWTASWWDNGNILNQVNLFGPHHLHTLPETSQRFKDRSRRSQACELLFPPCTLENAQYMVTRWVEDNKSSHFCYLLGWKNVITTHSLTKHTCTRCIDIHICKMRTSFIWLLTVGMFKYVLYHCRNSAFYIFWCLTICIPVSMNSATCSEFLFVPVSVCPMSAYTEVKLVEQVLPELSWKLTFCGLCKSVTVYLSFAFALTLYLVISYC